MGCKNAKYSQCQQILEIANGVYRETEAVINQYSDRPIDPNNWSSAVSIAQQGADKLENLSLKDPQLTEYQTSLVEIFRMDSQAFKDAIEARKNKDIKALKLAAESSKKAGLLKKQLVNDINSYCLGGAIVE